MMRITHKKVGKTNDNSSSSSSGNNNEKIHTLTPAFLFSPQECIIFGSIEHSMNLISIPGHLVRFARDSSRKLAMVSGEHTPAHTLVLRSTLCAAEFFPLFFNNVADDDYTKYSFVFQNFIRLF